MRRVPGSARPAEGDGVRALRVSDGLAGGALRGVRRPEDLVRLGARSGRLRGTRHRARRRLEGAWRPPRRRPGGRPGRRRRSTPEGDRSRLRPRRARPRGLARGQLRARARRASGDRWELPVARLLERTRRVGRQRGLTRTERRANVSKAFRATADAPACVCLVDDVYTTGSTVLAAATELRRAGAAEVHVVAFARVVRR